MKSKRHRPIIWVRSPLLAHHLTAAALLVGRPAQWMVQAAKEAGLSDVHIEEYPSDGEIYYYMDKTSPAWDVDFAELWIVEPEEERLTTYAEIPVSLAITSRSCDVKGELVFIGEGTSPEDYENLDVQGKVVLTADEDDAGRTVPVRNAELKGPLGRDYLNEKLAGTGANLDLPIFRVDSRIAYEVLNFIDGKNSLLDIRNAVSAEFEPVPLSWVKDFIDLLARADIIQEDSVQ